MVKQPARMTEFVAERWYEEADLLEGLQSLKSHPWIGFRLKMINQRIRDYQLPPPQHWHNEKVGRRARLLGLKQDYDYNYALFCKYCHANAMLAWPEATTFFHETFLEQTHLYAQGCLREIERYMKKMAKKLPSGSSADQKTLLGNAI
jgi:hypothetical protein